MAEGGALAQPPGDREGSTQGEMEGDTKQDSVNGADAGKKAEA